MDSFREDIKSAWPLHTVLHTLPDYVWLKNVDGVYLACNPAFERFFGATTADIVGKTDYDFVDHELADFFRQKDKEAIEAGDIQINEEWITLASDGSRISLETRKAPVYGADGEILGVLGIGRDITERKRHEARLALQDHALNQINESLFLLDEEARFVQVNEEPCRSLGYTREELLTMCVFDIAPDFGPEQWQAYQEEWRAGINRRTWETRHRTRDGRFLNVEVQATLVSYEGQRFYLCMVRDITESKSSERQLALLSHAVDMSGDEIHLVDGQGRIVYANAGMCRVLGYSREELLELTIPDIDPGVTLEQIIEEVNRLSDDGSSITFTAVHRDKHGQDYPVEISGAAFDYEGERFALAIARDIRERKQFEERLALQDRALNQIGAAIYLVDEDASILQVNDAACRMLGYSEAELTSLRVFDIDPNFPFEHWQQHWSKLLALGSMTMESQHRAKSGKLVPIEVVANAIKHQGRYLSFALIRDISERKQAAQALEQRESELRMLTAHLPDFIFRYDLNVRRTYVNKAVEQISGKSFSELVGKKPTEEKLLSQNEAEKLVATVQEVIKTGVAVEAMVELVTPKGEMQYHHAKYVPEFNSSGEITSVLAISRNVTERTLADRQLKQHEREFRTLAENTYNMIIRYDGECRRTYVNPAFLRETHIENMEEVLNIPLERKWVSVNITAQDYKRVLQRVMSTGRREDSLLEWPGPEGGMHSFVFTLTPEIDELGLSTGVLAIGHNITEFKRSELQLQQREREFRTLVENLPTYVVRLDRDLRHVYANPAYVSAIGLPETAIMGTHVNAFWRAKNITVDDYVTLLVRVLNTGIQEEVTLEWTSDRGRFYSHLVRVAPEQDANDKISGLLVLGFDITAQRREQLLEVERQRVFETMAQGEELAQILNQVASYIDAAGRGMRSSIKLLDESGQFLSAIAAPSFPEISAETDIDLEKHSKCCAVEGIHDRKPLYQFCIHTPKGLCESLAKNYGMNACWSEPIVASSGKVLGAVTVYLPQAGDPSSSDLKLLQQAANLCAIAIERKRIEEQMHRHASYDNLTGLLNRRLFGQRLREEIKKAERRNDGLGTLFIDLDHFKEVNDSLGHEVGDQLLVEAAHRIKSCVRESDTVARLGGDEFVVVLTQVDDFSFLGQLAQNIVEVMARPFHLGKRTAYVTASIGIARYPLDADSADSLIGCADQAMYAAKELGRNNFSFFTSAMQQQVQAKLLLAHDLRDALENRELQVYYQPIVDVATGEVVKAEALLRWKHPYRGMVSPDHFIPLAEEHGFIHDIGDWVFRRAVGVAKRWNDMREDQSIALRQVSVNISPRQFMKGHIDETWLDYLHKEGLDPACITVEITEGLLLDDRFDILEKLDRFGQAGMRVALDDFGTGYSAMAYLKKFPIDYLKIDRSFVRDIDTDSNDRAIAEAIVVMASKLGLEVIAEGVETMEQRDILAAVGCEYVQGYFYAKPMPEAEFLAYVSQC